jgi:chemotaxis protein MotB
MLVITLMALSDFESSGHPSKKKQNLSRKTIQKTKVIEENIQKPIPNASVVEKQDIHQPIIEKISNVKNIKKPQDEKTAAIKASTKNKLQKQLTKMIKDLGLNNSVDMTVTLGYAQLEIHDKILFKSSEAKLLDNGKSLLKKLAPLLDQSLGLIFIEGHTDNQPIKTEKFPSNWELGATRATNVLRYLITENISPARLRAMSSAATKPLADNSTEEGRERNRRVSIMIQVADKI